MKINTFKILTFFAALNSIILGLTAFLTVFMFRNNISQLESNSGALILICTLGALLTKFRLTNKPSLGLSILFDLTLIFFVYNPFDSNSVIDFFSTIIDPGAFPLIFTYIYLIIYYWILLKKQKHITPK
jgi:hypothetical protein